MGCTAGKQVRDIGKPPSTPKKEGKEEEDQKSGKTSPEPELLEIKKGSEGSLQLSQLNFAGIDDKKYVREMETDDIPFIDVQECEDEENVEETELDHSHLEPPDSDYRASNSVDSLSDEVEKLAAPTSPQSKEDTTNSTENLTGKNEVEPEQTDEEEAEEEGEAAAALRQKALALFQVEDAPKASEEDDSVAHIQPPPTPPERESPRVKDETNLSAEVDGTSTPKENEVQQSARDDNISPASANQDSAADLQDTAEADQQESPLVDAWQERQIENATETSGPDETDESSSKSSQVESQKDAETGETNSNKDLNEEKPNSVQSEDVLQALRTQSANDAKVTEDLSEELQRATSAQPFNFIAADKGTREGSAQNDVDAKTLSNRSRSQSLTKSPPKVPIKIPDTHSQLLVDTTSLHEVSGVLDSPHTAQALSQAY